MARIESGKSVLVESSESIVDMVEEVSNVFGAMAKEKRDCIRYKNGYKT